MGAYSPYQRGVADERKRQSEGSPMSNDMVRQEKSLLAKGLKIACYRVRDPETGEWGPRQYHMTYNNTVMAIMGEEAAKLFANFVTEPPKGKVDGTG